METGNVPDRSNNISVSIGLQNIMDRYGMNQKAIRYNGNSIILHFLEKIKTEAVAQRCSVKKACNYIKKETLAQVFSCEFCKTSKNNSGGCFCKNTQLITKLIAIT